MLLESIEIPKIFELYNCYLAYDTDTFIPELHYCPNCGQAFSASWPIRGNLGGRYVDDMIIYCPNCDRRYATREMGKDAKYAKEGNSTPLNMRINLEEFNYGYKLSVTGQEITPTSDTHNWYKRMYKEEISFNVNLRRTMYMRCINNLRVTEYELGNPFSGELQAESALTQLVARKGIRQYQPQFTALLKKLRSGIEKKLAKKVKHNINSLYCSHGNKYGPFIVPILNIAYRMICIDAPNLSKKVFSAAKLSEVECAEPLWYVKKHGLTSKTLQDIRQEKDTVTAFIKLAKLPNKRCLRKILTKEPFDYALLARIYKNFNKNIDDTVAIYKRCITPHHRDYYGVYYPNANNLVGVAPVTIGKYYSPNDATLLVKRCKDDNELNDTAFMLDSMPQETKTKFNAHKPNIFSLHDWLATENWKSKHKTIAFDIDNPICRRLAMQSDQIKFYLPGTSLDLYNAGQKLKNCVGSYANRVANKQTQIVLVSDNTGKLTICIEVQENAIMQAKLFANKPVSSKPGLNALVIDWAQKVGLKYEKCIDIRVPKAMETKRAVAVAV